MVDCVHIQVYGDPLQHPQTEAYWGNVNPIGERSCYDEGGWGLGGWLIHSSDCFPWGMGVINIEGHEQGMGWL